MRRLSIYLNLRIATPHPAVSLTIPPPKLVKPQSPMIQILPTKAKSAAVVAAEKKINLTVVEIHLSQTNQKVIVNTSLQNTTLVPITNMQHCIILI